MSPTLDKSLADVDHPNDVSGRRAKVLAFQQSQEKNLKFLEHFSGVAHNFILNLVKPATHCSCYWWLNIGSMIGLVMNLIIRVFDKAHDVTYR